MNDTMPRDERERYNRAFSYAVAEKDLQFATGDTFADWYTRVGHLLHGDDIAAAFAQWVAGPHNTG